MGWLKQWNLRRQIRQRDLELQLVDLEARSRAANLMLGMSAPRKQPRAYNQVVEESVLTTDFIDPDERYVNPSTGERWPETGTDRKPGPLDSEGKLQRARNTSRLLAITNPYAVNAYENRISYIVGTGHSYTVMPKPGWEVEEVADPLAAADTTQEEPLNGLISQADIEAGQTVIDDWITEYKWHYRQQEIVRRKDRDGECFLRFFPGDDGLDLRFVEPSQVAQPSTDHEPTHSFGIVTKAEDVETVEGYLIAGEGQVAAEEIQHRKQGVDANVKRGRPLLYPVEENLRRTDMLQRNMTTVSVIQSAIALIRKHADADADAITNWAQARAQIANYRTRFGDTEYWQQYSPGTIIDTDKQTEYEMPSQGIDASRFTLVLESELKSIAAMLVMPEFMFTSNASNANYASTMVAEGPAVKYFQRLQRDMIVDDLEVMDRVLDAAVEAGQLSPETRGKISIDVEAPRLESRDRAKEVTADMQLVTGGAMSLHTTRLRHDLEPEFEEKKIEEEKGDRDPFGGGGGDFGGPPGQAVPTPAAPTGEEPEEEEPEA